MTFEQDINQLARSVSRLLADDTGPRFTAVEQALAAASRDTILAGLLRTTGELAVRFDIEQLDIAARSFERLWAELSRVQPTDRPIPIDQLLGWPIGEAAGHWQQAARDAVLLEQHFGRISSGSAVITARAVAELAIAFPILDGILAAHLDLDRWHVTDRLIAAERHESIQAAALYIRHAFDHEAEADLQTPSYPRARPVRRIEDIVGATRHLAAFVERREKDLTTKEVRAGIRLLAAGHVLATRSLPALSLDALAGAGRLYRGESAPAETLTRPDQRVLLLASEIRQVLDAHDGRRPTGQAEPGADISGVMSAWLPAAAALLKALEWSLREAIWFGNLATVVEQYPSGQQRHFLWEPVRDLEQVDLAADLGNAYRAALDVARAHGPARREGEDPSIEALRQTLSNRWQQPLSSAFITRQLPASRPALGRGR